MLIMDPLTRPQAELFQNVFTQYVNATNSIPTAAYMADQVGCGTDNARWTIRWFVEKITIEVDEGVYEIK